MKPEKPRDKFAYMLAALSVFIEEIGKIISMILFFVYFWLDRYQEATFFGILLVLIMLFQAERKDLAITINFPKGAFDEFNSRQNQNPSGPEEGSQPEVPGSDRPENQEGPTSR